MEVLGKHLGPYKILTLLDHFELWSDYFACHENSKDEFKIRILNPKLFDDEQIIRTFYKNMYSITKINHPNIINILDIGKYEGTYFLVKELFDGKTLKTTLFERDLTIQGTIHIAKQVLAALHHAHKHDIIHGYVNPYNIYVDDDLNVKIGDFGQNLFIRELVEEKTELSIERIKYLSPEQIKNEAINFKTDFYSFGIVLYEMITGVTPFSTENAAEIIQQQRESSYAPPRDINAHIPIELENMIFNLLQPSIQKRQNYSQIQKQIDTISRSANKKTVSKRFVNATHKIDENLHSLVNSLGFIRLRFESILFVLVVILLIGAAIWSTRNSSNNHIADGSAIMNNEQVKEDQIMQLQKDNNENDIPKENKSPDEIKSDHKKANYSRTNKKYPSPEQFYTVEQNIKQLDKKPNSPSPQSKIIQGNPEIKDFGTLLIRTKVSDYPVRALVYIDEKYYESTGENGVLELNQLNADQNHHIHVVKAGFEEWQVLTEILKNRKNEITVNLIPKNNAFGTVDFIAVPYADTIYVDGSPLSNGTPVSKELPVGIHKIKYVNTALKLTWETEIFIDLYERVEVTHIFNKKPSGSVIITLKNSYEYGYGYVYINGNI